ncbi:hypothetical protein [Niastella populi]|uniref:Uncharacterized protein n=1 Tax=Niastella populi TaxID=550983 RepID=A0A1V9GCW7_9BACT|nr:hypothetical protein [Niastella populi]OQP68266.1 hypothetical protein A4R26_00190 [Niastella populi]
MQPVALQKKQASQPAVTTNGKATNNPLQQKSAGEKDDPLQMNPLQLKQPANNPIQLKQDLHEAACTCATCCPVQRVKVPDTHDHSDARRYAQERVYSKTPMVSGGSGRRVATCEACNKAEFMDRLQVDHMVPEAFLLKLLDVYNEDKARGETIADELQLDWTKRDEFDSSLTNENFSTSMRERYGNYKVKKGLDFKGYQYEVLSDTNNLWMLCPECNGKKEKTDKLLKVDYEALNDYYKNGSKNRKQIMKKHLSKWIKTGYYWDPKAVQQKIDIPNSPGYSDPVEMDL